MALLITDAEVAGLLTMEDAIDAVEEAFRQLASGGATMPPRICHQPSRRPRPLLPAVAHAWDPS